MRKTECMLICQKGRSSLAAVPSLSPVDEPEDYCRVERPWALSMGMAGAKLTSWLGLAPKQEHGSSAQMFQVGRAAAKTFCLEKL